MSIEEADLDDDDVMNCRLDARAVTRSNTTIVADVLAAMLDLSRFNRD